MPMSPVKRDMLNPMEMQDPPKPAVKSPDGIQISLIWLNVFQVWFRCGVTVSMVTWSVIFALSWAITISYDMIWTQRRLQGPGNRCQRWVQPGFIRSCWEPSLSNRYVTSRIMTLNHMRTSVLDTKQSIEICECIVSFGDCVFFYYLFSFLLLKNRKFALDPIDANTNLVRL